MWVTWTSREGYGRYKATIRVAGVKRRCGSRGQVGRGTEDIRLLLDGARVAGVKRRCGSRGQVGRGTEDIRLLLDDARVAGEKRRCGSRGQVGRGTEDITWTGREGYGRYKATIRWC